MKHGRLISITCLLLASCSNRQGASVTQSTTPEAQAREVVVPSAGLELEGTFTSLPVKKSPAVVFVHGSGPQSRDAITPGQLNEVFERPVPVFRMLADSLAKQGIASLRYDKRTCGTFNSCADNSYPMPEDVETISFGDFVSDACAALDWLKQQPEVDPTRVFLAGHSQGGHVAISAAERCNPAGLVILCSPLAGPAPITRLQYEITRRLVEASPGPVDARTRRTLEAMKSLASKLEKLESTGDIESPEIGTVLLWKSWTHAAQRFPSVLAASKVPVLAVLGKADTNVPADVFAGAWQRTPTAKTVVVADMTHALTTKRSNGSFSREQSPDAIEPITEFIHGP